MISREEGSVRSPGRPRDAQASHVILRAALHEFIEQGFAGMSIEAVAIRAGVGKSTIYRWWPSKEALVAAAVNTLYEALEVPDTGRVRDDVIALIRQMHSFITSATAGKVFPRMAGELAAGSSLGRTYMTTVIEPRRQMLVEVMKRGVDRGELRADLDAELAVDSILGSMVFLRLSRRIFELGDALSDQLVDQLITGMAA